MSFAGSMHDVLDALAFPRVGDVHEPVRRLNDRGIRILAGLAFQHVNGVHARAIARDATFSGVLPFGV